MHTFRFQIGTENDPGFSVYIGGTAALTKEGKWRAVGHDGSFPAESDYQSLAILEHLRQRLSPESGDE